MKVLFLDIDGVLNRRGTKERCNAYLGVDRELATKLTDWLSTTDIEIVLSSTWRKHADMWPHLNEAGIHWIDKTPDLGGYHSRGLEIEAWLAGQGEQSDGELRPIEAYAILDDIPVFLPHQMPRFVKTDEYIGLTDDNIEQLRAMFA